MEFGTEFLEFKIYINSIVQVYNTYVYTYVTRSTSNSLQKWYYSEKNLYTSHQKTLFSQFTCIQCISDAKIGYTYTASFHTRTNSTMFLLVF